MRSISNKLIDQLLDSDLLVGGAALKNTWVDGSWKQRADALEQENKWLGNENSQLKAQIKELIRNGRRDL